MTIYSYIKHFVTNFKIDDLKFKLSKYGDSFDIFVIKQKYKFGIMSFANLSSLCFKKMNF